MGPYEDDVWDDLDDTLGDQAEGEIRDAEEGWLGLCREWRPSSACEGLGFRGFF